MKRLVLLFGCITAIMLGQTAAVGDYQVSGVVIDHLTAHPLNHVLVQLVQSSKGGGEASAITTEDGQFRFLHVPTGKYQLTAAKRGQMPQIFAQSDGGYASAIVVDGRQKTDGIVFAMRTDAAISGSVIGEDGEPVAGAQVQLLRERVTEGEVETATEGNSNTNSSGQFHFGHLEAGKYYLCAYGSPWFSQPGPEMEVVYPLTFYGDSTDAGAARQVTLPEGGSESLQINLRSSPAIRVKLAGRTGGVGLFVPGPGGSQIPVSTSLTGSGRSVGSAFSITANGVVNLNEAPPAQSIELFNLAAGRYEVAFSGGWGGRGGAFKVVDLANGSTLTLDEVASISLGGKVLFDGPRPDGELYLFMRGQGELNTEVKRDGTFNFEHVTPGNYTVDLNSPALAVSSLTAKGANILHDKVELQPGAVVELTISATPAANLATLEGFAVHDGAAVPGAMVLLLPQDMARDHLIRRDQSDADGSFSLTRIAPGRYTLVAIDNGRELAYKSNAVIKPYLAGGLTVTIPLTSKTPLQVPVQTRRP